jgi:hypothetical protein
MTVAGQGRQAIESDSRPPRPLRRRAAQAGYSSFSVLPWRSVPRNGDEPQTLGQVEPRGAGLGCSYSRRPGLGDRTCGAKRTIEGGGGPESGIDTRVSCETVSWMKASFCGRRCFLLAKTANS